MFRRTHALGLFAASIAVALLAVAPAPSPAEGQGRNRARIYLVQGRVPRSLPGKNGLLNFGRRNHRKTLEEVTDVPVKDRSWLAKLIVQFARPIGDWQYDILYFKLDGGQREHVGSIVTVHVNDKKERTFMQKVELKRPEFQPRTKMELVLRVRGREAGKRRFKLDGVPLRTRYNGSVDFTE